MISSLKKPKIVGVYNSPLITTTSIKYKKTGQKTENIGESRKNRYFSPVTSSSLGKISHLSTASNLNYTPSNKKRGPIISLAKEISHEENQSVGESTNYLSPGTGMSEFSKKKHNRKIQIGNLGKCLDLFAGSGAMAIEAYSRGFDSIYMNDINKNALMVCKDNCNSLGIKDAYFYNMDYKEFVNSTNELFDMIILDPPYRMNQIDEILESVYKLLSFKGMIVFEMDKNSIYPKEYNDLKIYKNKEYGIKRVVVYKR